MEVGCDRVGHVAGGRYTRLRFEQRRSAIAKKEPPMSTKPQLPEDEVTPKPATEARLIELREEAMRHGKVGGLGIHPPGAPFPQASSQTGYYGVPMLKQPSWTWQVPLYFFVGGAAGSAGVLGAVADWVGDDYELASDARWLAVGG